jgi:hypothetical protein
MGAPYLKAILIACAMALVPTCTAQAQKGSATGASRLTVPTGGQVRHPSFSIVDRSNLLDPSGGPALPVTRGNDRLLNAGPANNWNAASGSGKKTNAKIKTDPNKWGEWISDVERPAMSRRLEGAPKPFSAGHSDPKPGGGSATHHPDFVWLPTSKPSSPSSDRFDGRYMVNGTSHRYSGGASQGSRAGVGVLKSTDGGQTWSKGGGFKSIGGLKNEQGAMD